MSDYEARRQDFLILVRSLGIPAYQLEFAGSNAAFLYISKAGSFVLQALKAGERLIGCRDCIVMDVRECLFRYGFRRQEVDRGGTLGAASGEVPPCFGAVYMVVVSNNRHRSPLFGDHYIPDPL